MQEHSTKNIQAKKAPHEAGGTATFTQPMVEHTPVQRQANNTGMPDNLKSGVEALSGLDMSDVKVHYNSDKPAQMQAHAYAQGTDIHLGQGQEKHLPHEAWHVVQQKQGRVKPTKQLKSKVNINDDKGLEKEADVMGAKANSIQLKANTEFSKKTKTPATNDVAQMVFRPYKVTNTANLRAIDEKSGGIATGWFGKNAKVGPKIPADTEIQVDADQKIESSKFLSSDKDKWFKAMHNGFTGAIRASKVIPATLTPETIAEISDDRTKKDSVASANTIMNSVSKVGGSAGKKIESLKTVNKLYGQGIGKLMEKNDNPLIQEGLSKIDLRGQKDGINSGISEVANYATGVGNALGAVSDFTDLMMTGRKLKALYGEKGWDAETALKFMSTTLKATKTSASMGSNSAKTYDVTSKLIHGQGMEDKTAAASLAEDIGIFKNITGVLKGIIDAIASGVKIWKKGKTKDKAEFFKSIASSGKGLLGVLKKLKVLAKDSSVLKAIPALGAIINGADALIGWLNIKDKKEIISSLNPKSEALRGKVIQSLVQVGIRSDDLTGDKKGDPYYIFYREKRGMMGYRKDYIRVNPGLISGIDQLHKTVQASVKNRITQAVSWFANLSVDESADKKNKGEIDSVLKQSKTIPEAIAAVNQLTKKAPFKTTSTSKLVKFLLNYLGNQEKRLSKDTEAEAAKVSTFPLIKQRLISLAANSNAHETIANIKASILEYELSDKLVEINEKRKSLSFDNVITAIANLVGDLSSYISAGAGKAISGVSSAYKGARGAGKFMQSQARKFGKLGGDKDRSKKSKHQEYVRHGKFLMTMWVKAADKGTLAEAQGVDLEKGAPELKSVKSYLEAAGVKVKDIVKADPTTILDTIVAAMKERK